VGSRFVQLPRIWVFSPGGAMLGCLARTTTLLISGFHIYRETLSRFSCAASPQHRRLSAAISTRYW
ncbi:hypothetical protein ABLN64_09240, partial [Mycobacterium tuberculosis]